MSKPIIKTTPLQQLIESVVGTGPKAARVLQNESNHSVMSLREKLLLNNMTDNSTKDSSSDRGGTDWSKYI